MAGIRNRKAKENVYNDPLAGLLAENDTMEEAVFRLNEEGVRNLLSIVWFQQHVNELFFEPGAWVEFAGDDSVIEAWQSSEWRGADSGDDAEELGLRKRRLGRLLRELCSDSGAQVTLELAKRLRQPHYTLGQVVEWTFRVAEDPSSAVYGKEIF